MFVHVHKSGGTTVCESAKSAGERIDEEEVACASMRFGDWLTHQEFDSSPPPERQGLTCAQRAAWASAGSLTWNSLEHELCEGDLCLGHFVYGTVLRETLARLQSVIRFWGALDVDRLLRCIDLSNASDCPVQKDRFTPPFPDKKRTYPFFDNFLVRTFAGCDAMNAPPGAVTRVHYDRAAEVLEQFDFVVPLANISSPRAQRTMRSILGWYVPEGSVFVADGPLLPNFEFSLSQAQKLRQINGLDIELTDRFFSRWAWSPPLASDST